MFDQQRIPGDNFGRGESRGCASSEVVEEGVEPSAMGLLENKTDYTKVDAFPRALPRYTKKGKRVRYESLGKIKKKIQTKSSICIIERFFFIYFKLRY